MREAKDRGLDDWVEYLRSHCETGDTCEVDHISFVLLRSNDIVELVKYLGELSKEIDKVAAVGETSGS